VLAVATALVMLYAFVTTRTVIGRQIYAVGQPMLAPISARRMMLHKSGVIIALPALLLQRSGTTYQRRRGIRPNARS
jgi:ABC-type xylose transport system permease subunit